MTTPKAIVESVRVFTITWSCILKYVRLPIYPHSINMTPALTINCHGGNYPHEVVKNLSGKFARCLEVANDVTIYSALMWDRSRSSSTVFSFYGPHPHRAQCNPVGHYACLVTLWPPEAENLFTAPSRSKEIPIYRKCVIHTSSVHMGNICSLGSGIWSGYICQK